MTSVIEKLFKKLKKIEEKAVVLPTSNSAGTPATVKVQVDTSDEENTESYRNEAESIFSTFNQRSNMNSLRVDVKIEEDVEDDNESDKISESGGDTVFGQGTNPKPEDETYLSLLKNTAPKPKKVIIKP